MQRSTCASSAVPPSQTMSVYRKSDRKQKSEVEFRSRTFPLETRSSFRTRWRWRRQLDRETSLSERMRLIIADIRIADPNLSKRLKHWPTLEPKPGSKAHIFAFTHR